MLGRKLQGAGGQSGFELKPVSATATETQTIFVPSSLPKKGLLVWHTAGRNSGFTTPAGWTLAGSASAFISFSLGVRYSYTLVKKIALSDAGSTLTGVSGDYNENELYVFSLNYTGEYTLGGTRNTVSTSVQNFNVARRQTGEVAPYLNFSVLHGNQGTVTSLSGISTVNVDARRLCEYQIAEANAVYPNMQALYTGSVNTYHVFQLKLGVATLLYSGSLAPDSRFLEDIVVPAFQNNHADAFFSQGYTQGPGTDSTYRVYLKPNYYVLSSDGNFYGTDFPGTEVNFYEGGSVTGINTSHNGGTSFTLWRFDPTI